MNISEILKLAIERNAADIILSAGNYPALKIFGEVVQLPEFGKIEGNNLAADIGKMVSQQNFEHFQKTNDLDFSIQTQAHGRFRVNAFKNKTGSGMVMRVIPATIPEFSDLHIPEIIKTFSERKAGLVLITGGVGSGKSTTMASLINEINKNSKRHIITVEDPIEFIHQSKNSIIEQREIGSSTESFESGLKYALRQASDVIMIGEMRDLETFRLALRAAETGNLVFATLHTSGAARTVSRIIDMFPGEEKDHIRAQVAESLIGVIWQDLIKTHEEKRIVATEVMVKNSAIENMIRENKFHQIDSAIETGREDGMISMLKYLSFLKDSGKINEEIFQRQVKRYGLADVR